MVKLQVPFSPNTVHNAFHGTGLEVAKRIARGEKFKPGTDEDLYLGDGVYFFEGCPELAAIYASPRHRNYGILRATVQLGQCLDMHTVKAVKIIKLVRKEISKRRRCSASDITFAAAINYYVVNINPHLDTVRATNSKVQHGPVFKGKFTVYLSELIICVKNIARISKVVLVSEGPEND